MYTIALSARFKRKFKKLGRHNFQLIQKIEDTIYLIKTSPFDNSLGTHKVNIKGISEMVFASEVDGEYRIAWNFRGENEILLISVGTHKEVYN